MLFGHSRPYCAHSTTDVMSGCRLICWKMNRHSALRGVVIAIALWAPVCLSPGQERARAVTTSLSDSRNAQWSALVIGNSTYPHVPELKNPANDADDFGGFLQRGGYKVAVQRDLTLSSMRQALQKFLQNASPGGRAVFFFAGHGVQIDGENYLLPVDFSATSQEAAKKAAYPLSEVLNGLGSSGTGLGIVVIDACRNNPFRAQGRSLLRGLAPVDAPLGTLIALAASPGQEASDNPDGRNGLFTGSLLQVLSEAAPVSVAVRKARDLVFKSSGGRQRPWIHDDVIGDFTFTAALAQKAPSENRLEMVQEGLRMYGAGDLTAAAEQFERARRANPANPYAHNAAGVAWARLGKAAAAVECYSRAIDLKPDYSAAYLNRGIAYLKAGRYKEAKQDFEWALAESSDDPVLVRLRGEASLRLRMYDEAEKDFLEVIRLDPTDPHSHVGLGTIAEREGRADKAIAEYRQALSLRPEMQEAQRRLEALTNRTGQE